jgi:hypothetical protein
MSFRRRKMRLRLIAVGLATAALGASSAQAAPVIPYLSQGQGITAEQRALLNGEASDPCILVAGRCIDLQSKAVADPAQSVAGRYNDHRGEAVADGSKSSTGLNDRIHRVPVPSPAEQQPSTTVTGTDDGFNWSDASVGAGSTLGLVLLAGMAAFTIRRSRKNQLAGT